MGIEYFVYVVSRQVEGRHSIKITKNTIPLPLKFKFESFGDAFGDPGAGAATELADGLRLRIGSGGAGAIDLEGFSENTKKGDEGSGQKTGGIGTVPDGLLDWYCDDVI